MPDIISHIQPFAARRVFNRHAILLYQGEVPRDAFVVLSGVVKTYSINAAGEEQIATFESRGDMFPSSWIFQKASSTIYYYEALTDVEVLTLPKSTLLDLFVKEPGLRAETVDYLAGRYTGMLLRITSLEQSRARDKIMFTLYYLLFRYGRQRRADSGVYAIELKLTHSIIAALVGLTRETTTNELSKLKSEGILNYTAHQYSVDKAKLERTLGEDSFENVHGL
jgi:CRP/FNR family transcriptional regulator